MRDIPSLNIIPALIKIIVFKSFDRSMKEAKLCFKEYSKKIRWCKQFLRGF